MSQARGDPETSNDFKDRIARPGAFADGTIWTPLGLITPGALLAQRAITTPKEAFGFNIGDDYHVASYSQLESYWKKLAAESDRMRLVDIGRDSRRWKPHPLHGDHFVARQPEKPGEIQGKSRRSWRMPKVSPRSRRASLAREGKAIIWIDHGGLHASESVGAQQLMETVYQFVEPHRRRKTHAFF